SAAQRPQRPAHQALCNTLHTHTHSRTHTHTHTLTHTHTHTHTYTHTLTLTLTHTHTHTHTHIHIWNRALGPIQAAVGRPAAAAEANNSLWEKHGAALT